VVYLHLLFCDYRKILVHFKEEPFKEKRWINYLNLNNLYLLLEPKSNTNPYNYMPYQNKEFVKEIYNLELVKNDLNEKFEIHQVDHLLDNFMINCNVEELSLHRIIDSLYTFFKSKIVAGGKIRE